MAVETATEEMLVARMQAMEKKLNPEPPERNSEGKGILAFAVTATGLLELGTINQYVWVSACIVCVVAYTCIRYGLKQNGKG